MNYDRVVGKLNRSRAKYHPLFSSDGEVNKKLPQTITKALGEPAEKNVETNKEEIARREKKIGK